MRDSDPVSTRAPIDRPAARRVGRLVNRALRPGGLEVRRVAAEAAMPAAGGPAPERRSTDPRHSEQDLRLRYSVQAQAIVERHRQQTRETVLALRKRYAQPVFGKVRVWELVERLGSCVDPTDERLYGASQQMHVRQMLAAMEEDGTATPDMVLVALIHDIGKVLLLTGEDPANVVCMNSPVGENRDGAGLDDALIRWNHDEFAYQRLKNLIPDDLAWLIRYHSLEIDGARHLMDARDLERTARLLQPFAHYDHATKSPFTIPRDPLDLYRDVIEEAFPDPISV
jgi:predicted HD phosphohydrolase